MTTEFSPAEDSACPTCCAMKLRYLCWVDLRCEVTATLGLLQTSLHNIVALSTGFVKTALTPTPRRSTNETEGPILP